VDSIPPTHSMRTPITLEARIPRDSMSTETLRSRLTAAIRPEVELRLEVADTDAFTLGGLRRLLDSVKPAVEAAVPVTVCVRTVEQVQALHQIGWELIADIEQIGNSQISSTQTKTDLLPFSAVTEKIDLPPRPDARALAHAS